MSTDPDAWIGWTNDPAETTTFTAWIRIGHSIWIYYIWPFRVTAKRFK